MQLSRWSSPKEQTESHPHSTYHHAIPAIATSLRFIPAPPRNHNMPKMDPKPKNSDTKPTNNESAHPLLTVWNWIAEVMDDSQSIKHSFAEKTCRNYNVNAYAPALVMQTANENCLDLQENDDQPFTIEENEVDADEDLL